MSRKPKFASGAADVRASANARPAVPALAPLTSISLRLPSEMIADLKALAAKRELPYQSLLKIFVGERLDAELGRGRGGKHADRPDVRQARGARPRV